MQIGEQSLIILHASIHIKFKCRQDYSRVKEVSSMAPHWGELTGRGQEGPPGMCMTTFYILIWTVVAPI